MSGPESKILNELPEIEFTPCEAIVVTIVSVFFVTITFTFFIL